MGTGLRCRLCGNDWGVRRITYEQKVENNFVVIVAHICEVCSRGKTDHDIFKHIFYKAHAA